MTAVREEGGALEYATEKLRGDREIAIAAVRHSDSACEYVSETLWANRGFVAIVAAGKETDDADVAKYANDYDGLDDRT